MLECKKSEDDDEVEARASGTTLSCEWVNDQTMRHRRNLVSIANQDPVPRAVGPLSSYGQCISLMQYDPADLFLFFLIA